MTNLPAPSGPTETLVFKNHPVRHIMLAGVPWFYNRDLIAIMRPEAVDTDHAVDGWWVPEFTRQTFNDPEEGPVTILSPIGAWYMTETVSHDWSAGIAAWTRREANRLCPEPAPGDPAMFLTVLEGPLMPPKPNRFSGRLAEWNALSSANNMLGYVRSGRLPIASAFQHVYELLRPPTTPEGSERASAFLRSLMDAGEAAMAAEKAVKAGVGA